MEELLFTAAKLSPEGQREFIDSLRDVLTDEELLAIETGIAYFRLLLYPELKDAMQKTIAEEMYKKFNMEV